MGPKYNRCQLHLPALWLGSACALLPAERCAVRGRRLTSFIKFLCPPGSRRREALVAGQLAFHIHGGGLDYDGSGGGACAVEHWYHAALQYRSPWRTTWHEVCIEDGIQELPESPDRRYVRSMVKFHCFHIGLQRLVECTRIFADVWDIEDSGRPVGNMRPNIVPIIRSGDHGRPMRWWPSKIKAGGGGGGGEEADIDVGPAEPPAADDAMIEDADRGDEVAEAGEEDGDELGDLLWVLRESYDAPLVEPPPPLPPPVGAASSRALRGGAITAR